MELMKRLFGKTSGQTGETAKNQGVRRALQKFGDDGTLPRHTLHYAYPGKGEAAPQQEIFAYFEATGLTTSEAAADGGVVAEHEREVASSEFDALTERFGADLAGFGWKYDGWECAVATRDN